MVSKLLFLFIILLSLQHANAQKKTPNFSIEIESQFLIAGELNASFDFLIGARSYYSFSSNKKLQPFLSIGFLTDVANTNARIISTDIQLGTNWKFSKRFSLLASLGGSYIDESHSHLLIEKRVDWKNTSLGLTGSIGVNYSITKFLSSTLSIKQNNTNFTSVGLGLNYSF